MKIISDGKTNCFVSPLNRTNLLDPAKINGPESPVSLIHSVYWSLEVLHIFSDEGRRNWEKFWKNGNSV